MRSTLDELASEIGNLKSFVESIGPVNELLQTTANSVIKKYLRGRRRLDYVAFIVSLYSAFESFIENLVWSYTQLESSRVSYSALPKELQLKHLKQSAELLVRARLGEGRYFDVTEKEVVENLHGCLSGRKPYTLNRSAVVHHDLNLRVTTIKEIFSRIGFDNPNHKARTMDSLIRWYAEVQIMVDLPSSLPEGPISYWMDDIVDRRNQISHGSASLDNYLGSKDMLERIGFVDAYGHALYTILAGDILRKRYVNTEDAEKLILVKNDGPYRNGHVVIVTKPSIDINKGQQVVGFQNDEVTRWGHIESIQIDGCEAEKITSNDQGEKLGICLDFKVTKATQLYALKKREDVVW